MSGIIKLRDALNDIRVGFQYFLPESVKITHTNANEYYIVPVGVADVYLAKKFEVDNNTIKYTGSNDTILKLSFGVSFKSNEHSHIVTFSIFKNEEQFAQNEIKAHLSGGQDNMKDVSTSMLMELRNGDKIDFRTKTNTADRVTEITDMSLSAQGYEL